MKNLSILFFSLVLIASTTLASGAISSTTNLKALILRTQKGMLKPSDLSSLRNQDSSVVANTLSQYLLDEKQDTDTRWFAAILMARVGSEDSLANLTENLSHEQFFVRLAAIKGLELMRKPVSISALHRSLFDSAMVVRAAAADAVGHFGNTASIEPLERGLFHKDNFLRGRSLWARKNFVYAIGSIGGQRSMGALLRCMNDQDLEVRRAALESLNLALEKTQAIEDDEVVSLSKAWLDWWKKETEEKTTTLKSTSLQSSSEEVEGDN